MVIDMVCGTHSGPEEQSGTLSERVETVKSARTNLFDETLLLEPEASGQAADELALPDFARPSLFRTHVERDVERGRNETTRYRPLERVRLHVGLVVVRQRVVVLGRGSGLGLASRNVGKRRDLALDVALLELSVYLSEEPSDFSQDKERVEGKGCGRRRARVWD